MRGITIASDWRAKLLRHTQKPAMLAGTIMIDAGPITARAINLGLICSRARHIRPTDKRGFGKPHTRQPIAHQRHLEVLGTVRRAGKGEVFFTQPQRIRGTGFHQRHRLIGLQ